MCVTVDNHVSAFSCNVVYCVLLVFKINSVAQIADNWFDGRRYVHNPLACDRAWSLSTLREGQPLYDVADQLQMLAHHLLHVNKDWSCNIPLCSLLAITKVSYHS